MKLLRKDFSQEKERILCAAIWYKDFDAPVHTVENLDKGVVLCGFRHGMVISQCTSLLGKRQFEMGESIQGFLTTKNRFLDRKEAHKLFVENGGVPEFKDELYSEDLY